MDKINMWRIEIYPTKGLRWVGTSESERKVGVWRREGLRRERGGVRGGAVAEGSQWVYVWARQKGGEKSISLLFESQRLWEVSARVTERRHESIIPTSFASALLLPPEIGAPKSIIPYPWKPHLGFYNYIFLYRGIEKIINSEFAPNSQKVRWRVRGWHGILLSIELSLYFSTIPLQPIDISPYLPLFTSFYLSLSIVHSYVRLV